MTESEFNQLADSVFRKIEQAADDYGIECIEKGTVLELEFDNGHVIIINRHTPTREIWVAARTGGFHYARIEREWISHRDGSELFAKLIELTGQEGAELKFN